MGLVRLKKLIKVRFGNVAFGSVMQGNVRIIK